MIVLPLRDSTGLPINNKKGHRIFPVTRRASGRLAHLCLAMQLLTGINLSLIWVPVNIYRPFLRASGIIAHDKSH